MPGSDEKVDSEGKIAIMVPSKDGEGEENKNPNDPAPGAFDGASKKDSSKLSKKKKKKKKSEEDENELSEEDKELKESLELAVTRLVELGDEGVTLSALEKLRTSIRTATSSMTAVPKPLKFLRPHFPKMKDTYDSLVEKSSQIAKELADVLSVLAMVVVVPESEALKSKSREKQKKKEEESAKADEKKDGKSSDKKAATVTAAPDDLKVDLPDNASLHYKLAGNRTDLATWGHEYIRHLAGEIGIEHARRKEANPPEDTAELMELVDQIVPFNLTHSAEAEAVDLLMEVYALSKLLSAEVDSDSTNRICNYLLRSALYIEDPDYRAEVYDVAYKLYQRQHRWCDVLRVALRANNNDLVAQAFELVKEEEPDKAKVGLIRKQMGFILGQHRYFAYQVDEDEEDEEEVNGIIGNASLSQHYLHLATDLDVTAAKDPKDVYKSHLANTGLRKTDGAEVKSALQSQAATYVNGFVNLGFGKDNLVTKVEEDGTCKWIYDNKGPGIMSATASLGMVFQWDVDAGMGALDKWCNVSDNAHVTAGAALGIGICNAGFYSVENDVAYGTLVDFVTIDESSGKSEADRRQIRISAIMALGLAYAGTSKEDVMETLSEIITDDDEHIDVVASAALSVGLICVGTGYNCDCFEDMLQRLMSASDVEKASISAKYVLLGVGLVFLGCGEAVGVCKALVETIEHPVSKFGLFTLDTCAYCGTGDVLKVQEMLHACSERLDGDEADFQTVAVLGIALIALGEEVGMQMAHRTMQHMLQYGELPIRRTVPLSLALLHLSDPDFSVVDTLSRLSHDPDKTVAGNAILAMGLVGCGTNNSRLAGMLKQLSVFYKKDANVLYVVRLAQGLLHMGKGLVTINPYHSDRVLLNRVAIAGSLIVLHGALSLEKTLLGPLHYHMYYFSAAARPRMLITLDEDLEPVATTVRVGEAVDTVGQAGHPRTITGFQTHNTPVLLHHQERAVFATDETEPIASVLEGAVISCKVSAKVRRERKLKEKRAAAAAAKAARAAREKLSKKSGGASK